MKVDIKSQIDPGGILAVRGLGVSDRAQILMAETVARLSDPYVPMSPGSGAHMKERHTVAPDGSAITYAGPYAHFQHEGEVMVGVENGSPYAKSGEPKVGTGQPLHYHGGPMRGKEWVKRMMADRGEEVSKAVAKSVGGKAK